MSITAYGRNGYYQLADTEVVVSPHALAVGEEIQTGVTWVTFRGKKGGGNAVLRGPAKEIIAVLDKARTEIIEQMEPACNCGGMLLTIKGSLKCEECGEIWPS